MPSVYGLLPSEKYLNLNDSYITDMRDKDNEPILLNYEQIKNLMIESGRNSLMFPFAENLHNDLDQLDLSEVKTYNFIGCGTKTIGGIFLKKKRSWTSLGLKWKDDFDLKYVNGDETVPVFSADETPNANKYFVKNISHSELPSVDGVKQDILAILKGEDLPISENILNDISACNRSGKIISTHSLVTLHIYDENGNHTGPDINGDIENNIEGVQYDTIEDESFAFLPDGVNYRIVTKATDTGGYSFQIKDVNKKDEITKSYNWTLIPINTLETESKIWIGPDYSLSEYRIKVDQNGDDIYENTFQMDFDGTEQAIEKTTMPVVSSDDGYSGGGGGFPVLPVALSARQSKSENNTHKQIIQEVEIEKNILTENIQTNTVNQMAKVDDKIKDENIKTEDNIKISNSINQKENKKTVAIQNISKNKNEQKKEKIKTIPLTASVVNSKAKIFKNIKLTFIVSTGILILLLLAKRFLKL